MREGTVTDLERLAETSVRLVDAGVDQVELERALEDAGKLLEAGFSDADVIAESAWLIGVPARELALFLRDVWAPGDASDARRRLTWLKNTHQRAAGARRRAMGVDPQDLLHEVEQLKASGEARGTRHALEIESERLHKSPDYLRQRLRQARGEVSRSLPGSYRDTSLPGSEGEGCNQSHRTRKGATK